MQPYQKLAMNLHKKQQAENRAFVKPTYNVNYALRLPPDSQTELQRRPADFRNFFCPSKIDTGDVQNCQKPTYIFTSCLKFARLLIGTSLPVLTELIGHPTFPLREFYWQPCHVSRPPFDGCVITACICQACWVD